MERRELSPHDETTLFQLVSIERSLPREEQSRRFLVKIYFRPLQAPEASIKPATTSKLYALTSDAECFEKLRAEGYIDRSGPMSRHVAGNTTVRDIGIIELLEFAFRYYDEKHDFPTGLADERREFVDSEISTVYPEVVAHLKKAYDAIWVDQPGGNWSGVAHTCQDALRAFANNIYKPEYASKLNEQEPSNADFEEKLAFIIRANASGSKQEKLRKLLVSLNDYLHARRHDMGTTREEAKRCVLYTYLLTSEIYLLIQGNKEV